MWKLRPSSLGLTTHQILNSIPAITFPWWVPFFVSRKPSVYYSWLLYGRLLVSLAEAHNVLNEPVRFEINKAPIQGKPEDNCEGNTPSHRPPRQNNHYRPTSGSSWESPTISNWAIWSKGNGKAGKDFGIKWEIRQSRCGSRLWAERCSPEPLEGDAECVSWKRPNLV